MHPGTLRALEFSRVLEALASYALTPLGADRAGELSPLGDRSAVEAALAETSEGVWLLDRHPNFPLRAPADFADTLLDLTAPDGPLEPLRLLGLADALDSIDQVRTVIRREPRTSLPRLGTLADRLASFATETRAVRKAIDGAGEVADDASPALRDIRDRLRRQRGKLRTTLEGFLRGRDTAKYLQEQVVTDRQGRYVVVVKSEHRHAIPGLIHGSSASGASLYLEPLATVEINNELIALNEEEKAEVYRILTALTNAFRLRAEELDTTIDAATTLDVVQAKARLAAACRASAPGLSTDGRLELTGARHPLLIPAVVSRTRDEGGTRVARDREPVAVDVKLIPPTRVLVITGPNTGGKTVALKTAALLALMAQCGLHIPAEAGSALPVFRTIFADIGDEQSIDANLSTFSWHVTNIAAMDRSLEMPALVLLDELGAGTDPVEGGALGMALVDHFKARGALVLATTHYDALKSYAATTPGVVAAAFNVNPETFAPTYRLIYGSPGASLALDMAARLGLPPSIVAAARGFRTTRESQVAEHLARVDQDLQALDRERREVAQARLELASTENDLRARVEAVKAREQRAQRKADDALQQRLRDARREIDRVVEDARAKAGALADAAATPRLVTRGGGITRPGGRLSGGISTGETGHLRADALAALDAVAGRVQTGESDDPSTLLPPEIAVPIETGVRVRVPPGLEGVVTSVQGKTAEISINGKRLRAPVADLIVIGRPGAPAPATVRVNVTLTSSTSGTSDLNVIGCTVPEAIERTDKFLDQAVMGELREIRVIHGHGTGQLRRALTAFLAEHPQVLRAAGAPPNQGGGGVTVVELKD
ncbi:MAG: Smr/MutS family protein [Vicinamibacteraceae bacterium]